jgi:hypothetical protein
LEYLGNERAVAQNRLENQTHGDAVVRPVGDVNVVTGLDSAFLDDS